MEVSEYIEIVGERIQNWIETSMTLENGCKRNWDEDDSFEEDEVAWMFTQRGQRLYESYLNKATKLIERKYPDEEFIDLESYTGVIYP